MPEARPAMAKLAGPEAGPALALDPVLELAVVVAMI
jgi:hypothetical protein